MNGKQFAVSTLFALILLTLAFIPISNQVGTYDPWLDFNDDGKIDVKDLTAAARAYGTLGNPTKTVTVTAYNWSRDFYDIIVGPDAEGNVTIITGGYRQITLGFRATAMMPPPFENVSIATGFLMGGSKLHVCVDIFNATPGWTGPERPILYAYPVARTYDIRGQLLTIAYYNPNLISVRLWIEYYMTA